MKHRTLYLFAALFFCSVCLFAQDSTPATTSEQNNTQNTSESNTDSKNAKGKKGKRIEKMQGNLNLSEEQKAAVNAAIETRKLIKTAQKTGLVSKDDTKAALKANKEVINATLTAEQQAKLDSTRAAVKEKRKAAKKN